MTRRSFLNVNRDMHKVIWYPPPRSVPGNAFYTLRRRTKRALCMFRYGTCAQASRNLSSSSPVFSNRFRHPEESQLLFHIELNEYAKQVVKLFWHSTTRCLHTTLHNFSGFLFFRQGAINIKAKQKDRFVTTLPLCSAQCCQLGGSDFRRRQLRFKWAHSPLWTSLSPLLPSFPPRSQNMPFG